MKTRENNVRRKDMSLKLYYSDRIEDLAEKLVGELKAERAAKGPFEFLNVAVANPNLGN